MTIKHAPPSSCFGPQPFGKHGGPILTQVARQTKSIPHTLNKKLKESGKPSAALTLA
jgi:hypothetical protein